jgi:hypothetical protein
VNRHTIRRDGQTWSVVKANSGYVVQAGIVGLDAAVRACASWDTPRALVCRACGEVLTKCACGGSDPDDLFRDY